ncbi:MAG: S41 family peptidase [Brevibacillus sp.]|nr:S41 family peptidase [Brevibacillus sp.]
MNKPHWLITVWFLVGMLLFGEPARAEKLSAAGQPPQVLEEIGSVYHVLLENHISRPKAEQLVQGALSNVAEQVAEMKGKQLVVTSSSDTFEELVEQLDEWRKRYGLSWNELHHWAINGMVETLNDPHTLFLTAEQLRLFQDDLENETVGFGLLLRVTDDYLLIKDVIADSPAEAAGIEPGDYLFAVDGKKAAGDQGNVPNDLYGEPGSTAVLTVYKPKQKQMLDITLMRAFLAIPEVNAARFSGDIGYIHISTFGSEAGYQFRDELDRISIGAPLKGLLIDLRDNGGGYLHSARDVASQLMEEGLLMYSVNRNGVKVETWVRNGRPVPYPVRILVNEGTASAAELLAGALRDHEIAVLLGNMTYGKGSAQQIIPLEDGDALKITLEEYYTPKRTVINQVGLKPDIAVEDDVAQVVEGLLSLGVKRIELRETAGEEVRINGVSFPLYAPLFQFTGEAERATLFIRGSVLSSLTGDRTSASVDFAPVESKAYPSGTIEWKRSGKEITLTFTMK